MLKIYFVIVLLGFCLSCIQTTDGWDKEISKSQAPEFLKSAVPKDGKNVEFYQKMAEGVMSYEVKYDKNKQEISHTFNEKGVEIEREENIEFASLEKNIQLKVKKYFQDNYKNWKVMEVEKRVDENQKQYIDIEISHDGGKTGFTEVTFSVSGDYLSDKIESADSIDTLN